MSLKQVNPTRMELTRLKKRLRLSLRGHKLLKDKRDELMKQFLNIVKENKTVREDMEKNIAQALKAFSMARAVMSDEVLFEALMYPTHTIDILVSRKNIMSVNVPVFSFGESSEKSSDIYPYGFATTSGELDRAVTLLNHAFNEMLRLASLEKSTFLLSYEIEKTRRRVNALEYVLIPSLRENIRRITMKLDENERGNLARLMKVKELMIADAIKEKRM